MPTRPKRLRLLPAAVVCVAVGLCLTWCAVTPAWAQTVEPPQPLGVLLPLYASFAGLQALDAHSTLRAINSGATERNPLMTGVAGQPAALFALKAGTTAATIYLVERIRPKNRVAAMAIMAGVNSFYAAVVIHNYRAAR
jgi:hypothetical protein